MPLSLHIFEPRYRQLIADLLNEHDPQAPEFGVVALRAGWEVGTLQDVYQVGTTARVTDVLPLPDGRCDLSAVGERRFVIEELDTTSRPYLMATVRRLAEPDGRLSAALVSSTRRAMLRHRQALARLNVDYADPSGPRGRTSEAGDEPRRAEAADEPGRPEADESGPDEAGIQAGGEAGRAEAGDESGRAEAGDELGSTETDPARSEAAVEPVGPDPVVPDPLVPDPVGQDPTGGAGAPGSAGHRPVGSAGDHPADVDPIAARELSYAVACQSWLPLADRQQLLACPDTAARLRDARTVLRREAELVSQLRAVPVSAAAFRN